MLLGKAYDQSWSTAELVKQLDAKKLKPAKRTAKNATVAPQDGDTSGPTGGENRADDKEVGASEPAADTTPSVKDDDRSIHEPGTALDYDAIEKHILKLLDMVEGHEDLEDLANDLLDAVQDRRDDDQQEVA